MLAERARTRTKPLLCLTRHLWSPRISRRAPVTPRFLSHGPLQTAPRASTSSVRQPQADLILRLPTPHRHRTWIRGLRTAQPTTTLSPPSIALGRVEIPLKF